MIIGDVDESWVGGIRHMVAYDIVNCQYLIRHDCYINGSNLTTFYKAPIKKWMNPLTKLRYLKRSRSKFIYEGLKMKSLIIAMVCHEVNKAYCEAMGDMSQPPWDKAPEWQKDSAFLGVELHTNNNVGPEASHESWMNQKLAEGWVWGEVKDPEAKTHPCIVPFDELPKEQQAKDYIFRAIVHSLRDCPALLNYYAGGESQVGQQPNPDQ